METTTNPLGVSNGCTNDSEDPRVEIFREISRVFSQRKKGMANIENVIALMDTPGIGDPQSIRIAKENGMGWDRSVPIGGQVTIVNLKARKDLNGEIAQVISHMHDEGRIGVKVLRGGNQTRAHRALPRVCCAGEIQFEIETRCRRQVYSFQKNNLA